MARNELGRLGLVGLGMVGRHFADHLMAANGQLNVFDLDAARLSPALEKGADAAASARELAEGSEIILLSLPSPEAVRAGAAPAEPGPATSASWWAARGRSRAEAQRDGASQPVGARALPDDAREGPGREGRDRGAPLPRRRRPHRYSRHAPRRGPRGRGRVTRAGAAPVSPWIGNVLAVRTRCFEPSPLGGEGGAHSAPGEGVAAAERRPKESFGARARTPSPRPSPRGERGIILLPSID